MEDLKLLVRTSDDEPNDVPFGTEGEDERKESDGKDFERKESRVVG